MLKPGDLVQVYLPLQLQPGFLHEKRGITIKTFEYANDKESIGWITFIDGFPWSVAEVYLKKIG